MQQWQMAVATLLTFTLYLRPSECLRLRAFQLIPPSPELGGAPAKWSVVVAAAELKVPSKTGEFDATVVLDRPELAWMHPYLLYLLQHRLPDQLL